jgi:hypothetical protein
LKKKKKGKKFNDSKVAAEIEKGLRSKLLKIFEDLMGKRPAVEIAVHII